MTSIQTHSTTAGHDDVFGPHLAGDPAHVLTQRAQAIGVEVELDKTGYPFRFDGHTRPTMSSLACNSQLLAHATPWATPIRQLYSDLSGAVHHDQWRAQLVQDEGDSTALPAFLAISLSLFRLVDGATHDFGTPLRQTAAARPMRTAWAKAYPNAPRVILRY